jgi:hypothetical protein
MKCIGSALDRDSCTRSRVGEFPFNASCRCPARGLGSVLYPQARRPRERGCGHRSAPSCQLPRIWNRAVPCGVVRLPADGEYAPRGVCGGALQRAPVGSGGEVRPKSRTGSSTAGRRGTCRQRMLMRCVSGRRIGRLEGASRKPAAGDDVPHGCQGKEVRSPRRRAKDALA